jgi:hypothetical protein
MTRVVSIVRAALWLCLPWLVLALVLACLRRSLGASRRLDAGQ